MALPPPAQQQHQHVRIPPPFDTARPAPRVLAQGAEAVVFRSHFLHADGRTPCAVKWRPAKTWRHAALDARLTRHRILAEARILAKCRRDGIAVPAVLALDWEGSFEREEGEKEKEEKEEGEKEKEKGDGTEGRRHGGGEGEAKGQGGSGAEGEVKGEGGNASPQKKKTRKRAGGWMMVEWIEGITVRKSLDAWLPKHVPVRTEPELDDAARAATAAGRRPEVVDLMRRVGRELGRMHQAGVVHGDLTTSNIMLRHKKRESDGRTDGESTDRQEVEGETTRTERPPLDGDVVLIDFGLAVQAIQDEDRAVDLYVLERAFGSTHPNTEDLFDELLNAYGSSFKGGKTVLKRLEGVRLRGRKKSMIG